jgi:hypothetical protein
MGRHMWATEAVGDWEIADIDVVINVVTLAVVLVDVLDGRDCLTPVERQVTVGVHGR